MFFQFTSFLTSSNRYPNDNLVATLAIGYPVALEASADDLDTLGLISIIAILK